MLIWWFAGGFALLATVIAVSACIAAGRSEITLAGGPRSASQMAAPAERAEPARRHLRQDARP